MTEERLKEIADEWGCNWYMCHEAMKQAVNEALDEAANNQVALGSVNRNVNILLLDLKERNKKRILNLKVK